MKKAIIRYEKVLYKEGKGIKILGWENIEKFFNLPTEYTNEPPAFYEMDDTSNTIKIIRETPKWGFTQEILIHKGQIIDAEEFQVLVSVVRQASRRLHNILQKNQWQGKGEIEI